MILGFLREFWGASLPSCKRPEIDLLLRVFSLGIRDTGFWKRQCQETARILEQFMPGILGQGQVRCLEILNGSAHAAPIACAAGLDPGRYEEALAVLGLKGDLKRWYRDQSYSIEIRELPRSRYESHPSGFIKWRLDDPCHELDVAYSLSMSPYLIPGVSTYKRGQETGPMAPGHEAVPDLLIVLDSSRSMDGPKIGTKTHKATLAAFKACQYAHAKGAEDLGSRKFCEVGSSHAPNDFFENDEADVRVDEFRAGCRLERKSHDAFHGQGATVLVIGHRCFSGQA